VKFAAVPTDLETASRRITTCRLESALTFPRFAKIDLPETTLADVLKAKRQWRIGHRG